MKTPVNSVSDIGLVVRAVRRASQVRLDDLAACACAGVSNQFASDLDHGKPSSRPCTPKAG